MALFKNLWTMYDRGLPEPFPIAGLAAVILCLPFLLPFGFVRGLLFEDSCQSPLPKLKNYPLLFLYVAR